MKLKISPVATLLVAGCLASLCLACAKKTDNSPAMPRPEAYPRIELPAAAYDTLNIHGLHIAVNSLAERELQPRADGNQWLTVDYAPAGISARLLLTLVPVTPSTVQDVVDNRAERISLNLGSAVPSVTDINPDAAPAADAPASAANLFFGQLIEAPSTSTPLQLLLTDAQSNVITAAVYFPELSSANRDSLAPQLEYLRTDLLHLANSL